MAQFAQKDEKVKLFSLPKNYTSNMKAQPKYKWYKPLIAIPIFAVIAMILNTIVDIARALYAGAVVDPMAAMMPGDSYVDVNYTDPISILLLAASVAVMIPAAAAAMKVAGLGGLRTLSSIEGRFRWDIIKKVALPAFGLMLVLMFGITVAELALSGEMSQLAGIRFAPLALIAVILFIPFQCAAEEYLYRGVIMQTAGSWIPVVVVSCLVQAIVFSVTHGYNLIGNIGILINGFILGWLAIKTGGIEASTCLHSANNVCTFMLASLLPSAAMVTSISIVTLVVQTIVTLAVTAFIYYLCKKNSYVLSDKQPEQPAQLENAEIEQA